MTPAWGPADLALLTARRELDIAPARAGGTAYRWTPIWVVVVADQVVVRTWQRRTIGGY